MFVYRVIEKDRYEQGNLSNSTWNGINTFEYDKNEYIHFFILPESANIFQLLRYKNCKIDSIATKWDIPYSLLKDNFGVGMYRYYQSRGKNPFLEVKIKKNDLRKEMLVDSNETFDEWFDEEIYNRYLESIININENRHRIKNHQDVLIVNLDKNIMEQVEKKPKLNPNFNFLNYFPKSELDKEGLTSDYEIEPEFNDTKQVNKTFSDKIKNLFKKKR